MSEQLKKYHVKNMTSEFKEFYNLKNGARFSVPSKGIVDLGFLTKNEAWRYRLYTFSGFHLIETKEAQTQEVLAQKPETQKAEILSFPEEASLSQLENKPVIESEASPVSVETQVGEPEAFVSDEQEEVKDEEQALEEEELLDLDKLTKAELLKLAESKGLDVDGRLSATKLRAALKEMRFFFLGE